MSTRLTRRAVLRGMIGTGGAILLSGCGGMAPAAPVASQASPTVVTSTAPPVGIVRFAWGSDVGSLTPFQVSAAGPAGAVLLTLIYDTLTWKDADGIIPWLAAEWGVGDDGRSYTFQLAESAWHDGEPVTAEDVRFSFKYYSQFPYRWMPTDVVESAQVTGEREVRVQLKRPYAAFIEDIAGVVPIIPAHVWRQVADPMKYTGRNASTGSGPFRLVRHDEAEGTYLLEAHQEYWRGSPRVAEWRQLSVPPEARVEIVRQDGADISLSTDASVRELLADHPRLKVYETAPLSLVRLAINTERPPLDRKEVRQAIVHALDRQRIAEAITRGPAIVGSSGVVPPETPWHNPSLRQYEYDPERARALLGGRTYTLNLIADAGAREPELMAPMLEAVGIKLNVRQADAPTRTQLLSEGDFQIALTSHIGVGGDPDYLRRWYVGEEANAFAQGSIFDNEEYARLGEEQAATLDTERRREIVHQMQEILAEHLPTIVLYHRRFYWVYDASVFTPMETFGGLMNGIPFPNNKLTLIGS